METLLVLALLALLAVGAVLFVRQRRAVAEAAKPVAPVGPRRGTVRTLEVGDVVEYDGRMWMLEGSLRFDEGGFVWHEHLLVDGADRWWLSVEDDDGALELVRWDRLRGVSLEPSDGSLTHDGVTYAFSERGSAAFTTTGNTGAPASGRADYADYEQGELRLGLERFGGAEGTWETSVGRVISEHVLEVYPGGDSVTAAGAVPR